MYKLIKNPFSGEIFGACKQEGDLLISFLFDPANTDYQEYLKWVAEGNEPLPAENE
jgi:hypothetical protein